MRKLALFGCLAISLATANFRSASAQEVSFIRHFKVGQSYSYRTKSTSTGSPKLNMVMQEKVTVLKVYPNGDADIRTSLTAFSNKMNGKDMPAPKIPEQTQRVNKFGVVQGSSGAATMMGISGADLSNMMPKVLKVGQTVKSHMHKSGFPLDYTYDLTLTSLKGSIAQVNMSMVMTYNSAQAKIPPMHGKGTMLYDTRKEKFTSMIFSMQMPSMGTAGGTMISKTVLLPQ